MMLTFAKLKEAKEKEAKEAAGKSPQDNLLLRINKLGRRS